MYVYTCQSRLLQNVVEDNMKINDSFYNWWLSEIPVFCKLILFSNHLYRYYVVSNFYVIMRIYRAFSFTIVNCMPQRKVTLQFLCNPRLTILKDKLFTVSDLLDWVEHLELGVGGTVRSEPPITAFLDPTVSTVSDTSNGWICDWLWLVPEKGHKLLILGKMGFDGWSLLLCCSEDMLLMSWWAVD